MGLRKKPNITNLATNTAHTAVENKTPTQEFNKLNAQNFASRLAQPNLASKSDIANFIKKTRF